MKARVFIMALMAAVVPAYAVDYTWNGTTGDFQTGANWTPTGVPGGADNALFTSAGPYGVSFSDDATNTAATVGAVSPGADVTFDLAGHTWQLGSFSFANTGTARFGGGTLQVGSAVSSFRTERNLILESGSARFGASLGSYGMSDGGTIEVHGGDHQSVGVVLYSPPAGGVSLWMTNGSYTSVKNVNGNSLTLYNAAKAVFEGGTFIHTGNINLYDNSSLNVYSNAAFVSLSSGPVTVGYQNGRYVAALNIAGGMVSNSSSFSLGRPISSLPGTGVVNITSGSLYLGAMYLGAASNGVGLLLQSGGGVRSTGSYYVGGASRALGKIEVSGGQFFTPSALFLGCANASTGRLEVSGGEVVVSNSVTVGNNPGALGEVSLSGGQMGVTGSFSVGNAAGATGEVAVSGGTLSVSNNVTVGAGYVGASGRLEISGGTNDFGNTVYVGRNGAVGYMKIAGGCTYVTNPVSYDFCVGTTGGTGQLDVAGGTLTVLRIRGGLGYSKWSRLLLNGGTLQHSGSYTEGSFLNSFHLATLTDNGAVVDSNGGTVTIPQALSNETGCAGSFTKKGAGKVTLSSPDNAFTGRASVEEGDLTVSGAIYLTGGVATDAGAVLNLASATVRDATTVSGTDSRIDGALVLPSGVVLTNGVNASLGGSGVITGSVVFASGSMCGRDKTDPSGALQVTGNVTFENGATIALTGYTLEDLKAGIPLLTGSGTIQKTDPLAVTLDGVSHPYWRVVLSEGGTGLMARVVPAGTLIRLF